MFSFGAVCKLICENILLILFLRSCSNLLFFTSDVIYFIKQQSWKFKGTNTSVINRVWMQFSCNLLRFRARWWGWKMVQCDPEEFITHCWLWVKLVWGFSACVFRAFEVDWRMVNRCYGNCPYWHKYILCIQTMFSHCFW